RSSRTPTAARSACAPATAGFICVFASPAVMSVVATIRRTSTRARIFGTRIIRSSGRSSRARRGAGASSTKRSSTSYRAIRRDFCDGPAAHRTAHCRRSAMITAQQLQATPLLAQVPERELAVLASRAADVYLRQGDWLIQEGEVPAFFIVLSGRITVSKF